MSKGTILIVDEDQSFMNLLKVYLEADAYIVQILSSGKEVFVEAQSDLPPDVIVINSRLADMSGLELFRELRRNMKSGSSIPIIFLSEDKPIEDRLTSLDTGPDDFITKPFARGELKARVKALIRRSRALSEFLVDNSSEPST